MGEADSVVRTEVLGEGEAIRAIGEFSSGCLGSDPAAELFAALEGWAPFHVQLDARKEGVRLRVLRGAEPLQVGSMRLREGEVPFGTVCRVTGGAAVRLARGRPRSRASHGPAASLPEGVVVGSDVTAALLARLLRVASGSACLLIEGEPGVGKRFLAEVAHRRSARREGPFVVLACRSVPAEVMVAELFGCEQGGCPGRVRMRFGALERAEGGTLLLDEVGRLPGVVQQALWEAIERGGFRRAGGGRWVRCDVRLLATSSQCLRSEVNEGRFLAALHRCLAEERLRVPPLRDRPEEIEPLVRHFTRETIGREPEDIPERLRVQWRRHGWPGNVRELRGVVVSSLGSPGIFRAQRQ